MEKFLILVMLAGGAQAFLPVPDTECNVTQTSPCSVTVGGSVFIQLMGNASGYRLQCTKVANGTSIKVFNLRKEKVTLHEAYRNRTEFFINTGTLKIINVQKEDSGQYSVEVHSSDGILVANIQFTVDVKENILVIPILVCAALVFLIFLLLICCCLCRAAKNRKKSGAAI